MKKQNVMIYWMQRKKETMYWTASHAFKILYLNIVNMMDLKTYEMGAV
jgi:hypothetical protein